jgi:hypothetical protein
MTELRMISGKLDERGVLPLLEMALTEEWSGALRLKRGRLAGALWIVKGNVAHATLTGSVTLTGAEAFEAQCAWQEGEYVLEAGVLPPERTIRTASDQLIAEMRKHAEQNREEFADSQHSAVVGRKLLHVFDGLRERVPGLESLSLMRGPICEATTSKNATEIDWMDRQLKSFFAKDHEEPDTLFVQEGTHSLLILKRGMTATVLSARTGTAPEALFWAGAEAQRQVQETSITNLPRGKR